MKSKKHCEGGSFDHFYAAGFGQLDKAFYSLLNDKLISMKEANQADWRSKKVYSVSSASRKFLADESVPELASVRLRYNFLFETLFRKTLPAHNIGELIDDRIVLLHERLYEMDKCRERRMPGGGKLALGFGSAVYEAGTEHPENHRCKTVGAAFQSETDSIFNDAAETQNSRNPS